jgi:hypothetical protein
MEFSDSCELFEADPFKRVDVAFFSAIGRDRECELASGIPSDGALLREKLGEIAKEWHS